MPPKAVEDSLADKIRREKTWTNVHGHLVTSASYPFPIGKTREQLVREGKIERNE